MDFSDKYNQLKQVVENDISNMSLEDLVFLLHEAKETQKSYENLQLVVKRNANSLYGVSASIYFSLHDTDIAEDITMTGKHFAVIVDKAINNFFVNWGDIELEIIKKFYPEVISLHKFVEYKPDTIEDVCVYGDTDSRYLDIGKIYSFLILENGKGKKLPEEDKELSEFVLYLMDNFINALIKRTIDTDCDLRNARKGFLKMNHEVTTRKCVFQKKKKYIMTMIWKDGKFLKEPKIKFQGVEIKRGSSCPRSKKILTKLIDKFMLENYSNDQLRDECLKLIKYIKGRKEKDFIYLITSVSGLGNIVKTADGIYKSDKNHIQMQIAVSWLNFIEDNNLQKEYKPLFEGQKVNYYYCKENSKYKVIGIPDDININKVINLPEPDWNRMLNATLLKPLLKYIYDMEEISDDDIRNFLLGIRQWNF